MDKNASIGPAHINPPNINFNPPISGADGADDLWKVSPTGQVVGFVVTGESFIMLALRSISLERFVVDELSNIVTISNCM